MTAEQERRYEIDCLQRDVLDSEERREASITEIELKSDGELAKEWVKFVEENKL